MSGSSRAGSGGVPRHAVRVRDADAAERDRRVRTEQPVITEGTAARRVAGVSATTGWGRPGAVRTPRDGPRRAEAGAG